MNNDFSVHSDNIKDIAVSLGLQHQHRLPVTVFLP